MGGACCSEAVQGFLYNLFNDPYIIQLPKVMDSFQSTLADRISTKRAPSVAKNYEMIGGGSPILPETQAQANALEKRLNQENDGHEYKTYVAMRYCSPFLIDAMRYMRWDQIEDLTVIPLYPQYSKATTGSSIIECKEKFPENEFMKNIPVRYVESFEDNENFIELISLRVLEKLEELEIIFKRKELELQKQKEEQDCEGSQIDRHFDKKINLLFSAHGLPVKYVEQGDPYQRQVEDGVSLIVQKIAEKLNLKSYKNRLVNERLDIDWQITFQSRVGPVKWLEPNTEDVLIELGNGGNKNVLIVPISFVGDHIETLHELGIEYYEVAEEHHIENYMVTRLPKDNPMFIEALVDSYKKVNNYPLQRKTERINESSSI